MRVGGPGNRYQSRCDRSAAVYTHNPHKEFIVYLSIVVAYWGNEPIVGRCDSGCQVIAKQSSRHVRAIKPISRRQV
jgi:hypothetical protein